jgi:hypothetical protein
MGFIVPKDLMIIQHHRCSSLYSVGLCGDWLLIIRKHLKGNPHSLMEVQLRQQPRMTAQNQANFNQNSRCPIRDRTEGLLNTSLEPYRCTNLLGDIMNDELESM